MPTQTANPIPTQLNIAPRGKRWKDWQLVDSEIGFPTREAMEKYHCHPERVKSLEEERLALLYINQQLNQLNDRQAAQIKELEAQLEAVGAGGVEPLRKGMVPLSEVLARLEQGFGPNSAPVTTLQHHFLRSEHGNDAAVQQGVQPKKLVLNGYQLREALLFICPNLDFSDEQEMSTEVVISDQSLLDEDCKTKIDDGPIAYLYDYPEEGAIPLSSTADSSCVATHPTQQGLAEDSQDAERFRKFAAAMLRQDSVFEEAIDAYPEPDFDNLTIDDVRAVVDAGIAAVEAAQAKQGVS